MLDIASVWICLCVCIYSCTYIYLYICVCIYFFHHKCFDGAKLRCVKWLTTVEKEGYPDYFFNGEGRRRRNGKEVSEASNNLNCTKEVPMIPLIDGIHYVGNCLDDILAIRDI